MFERCIALEPTFIPAYLELIKLRPGIASGRLLREVVRLSPEDQDRHAQYGFWLLENGEYFLRNMKKKILILFFYVKGFVLAALKQFQVSIKIKETHLMSFIGVCRSLRKQGQNARLHQVISR